MGSHEGTPRHVHEIRIKRPATPPLAQSTQEPPGVNSEMILAQEQARIFLHLMSIELLESYYPQLTDANFTREIIKQRGRALLFRELVSFSRVVPIVTTSNTIGEPNIDEDIITIPIGASRINEDLSRLNEDEIQQRYSQFDRMLTSALTLFSQHPNLMPFYNDLSDLYPPPKNHR